MLKPPLARGELHVVGATTLDEYRRHIEKDAALERRFAPVYLDEPSTDDTIEILTALKPRYEAHHGVAISEEAIDAAVRLSQRYLTERHLPDKAIDLIDEAASRLVIDNQSPPTRVVELRRRVDELKQEQEAAAQREDYETRCPDSSRNCSPSRTRSRAAAMTGTPSTPVATRSTNATSPN